MPTLADVTLVAKGEGRRNGKCTVFALNKKLIAGAIVHEKGDGGYSIFNGDHLVKMAYDTLINGKDMEFNCNHYDSIPLGVVTKALIGHRPSTEHLV